MKDQDLSWERIRTEIIFNFLISVKRLAKRFKPDTFVFAWDSRRNLRKKIMPEYKIGRDPVDKTDEEKRLDKISFQQFTELRMEVLPSLGFKNVLMQSGFEGDDVIASVVMNNKGKFVVVSADGDLYQLLPFCNMYNPIINVMRTDTTFREKWDINPSRWWEVKALAGCGGGKNKVGDNVQGIPGVGETTAIKYLTGKLRHSTATFKKIESREGKKTKHRNRRIVKLPFEGTKTFTIQKEELYARDFIGVFDQYGFKSFTYKKEFREWTELFHLR